MVKIEELSEGERTNDVFVPEILVKEEVEGMNSDVVGSVTREHPVTLGVGGVVPGVSSRPHGNIPALLGFSEDEERRLFGSKDSDVSVPYLGEGSSNRRRKVSVRRGNSDHHQFSSSSDYFEKRGVGGNVRKQSSNRPSLDWRSRNIRPLGMINSELRSRPLQNTHRFVRTPLMAEKSKGSVPTVSFSFHRWKYDESSEGFGKTGRYHPEDARLKALGHWDAIYEDLELYKIPPPYWPRQLSWEDFYPSSSDTASLSSSDNSGM